MIDALIKLLKVKSLVTLTLTVAFVFMLFNSGEINKELIALFSSVYGSVITYFFTRKDDDKDIQ